MNNLCQFLPQELMGNLSLMNPAQILIETETALDPNLLASHKNAISTQKDNSTVVQVLWPCRRQTTDANADFVCVSPPHTPPVVAWPHRN